MKAYSAYAVAAVAMLVGMDAPQAADLKDQVKVEIQGTELHSGMQPGTYICAAGHLHIKANVQNLSDVAVGTVKVAGRVMDADGKVLGTATASTRQRELEPKQTAPLDMEFLSITGPLIDKVKNKELTVVAVAPKP